MFYVPYNNDFGIMKRLRLLSAMLKISDSTIYMRKGAGLLESSDQNSIA